MNNLHQTLHNVGSIASTQLPPASELRPLWHVIENLFVSSLQNHRPYKTRCVWNSFPESQMVKWSSAPLDRRVTILRFIRAHLTVTAVCQNSGGLPGFCGLLWERERCLISSLTTAENTKPEITFDITPSHGMRRWDEKPRPETWRCAGSTSVCSNTVHSGVRKNWSISHSYTKTTTTASLELLTTSPPPSGLQSLFSAAFPHLQWAIDERLIAHQKTVLFCYTIKNTVTLSFLCCRAIIEAALMPSA